MDGLLAGCLLAFVVAARPGVKVSRIAFWAGVAVAAACTVESNTHFAFVLLPGLVAVSGMLLVAGSISSNAGAFLKWRPLRYTGRISYGLYLWHVPLFAHLHEPLPIRVVVGFVAAFALAGLSFRYVEEPFLRRKHRLGRRVSTPAAASLA